MAMVVQHNMSAMNANRQLGSVTTAQSKSTEKLSSGYRINRAGDDAAGLKISEKMRSQIRGLNKASSNAQDGVSLIQTAEGALTEAHSILQRMNELAVQGANDTNESIDRDAINEELTALTEELDRISSTTQFNKQNLLDGSFKSKNLQVGANSSQKIAISIGNMDAESLGLKKIVGLTAKDVQTGTKINSIKYNGMEYTYSQLDTLSANKAEALSAFKDTISKGAWDDMEATYKMSITAAGSGVYYDGAGTAYSSMSEAVSADISEAKADLSSEFVNNFTDYIAKTMVTATDNSVKGTKFTLDGPSVDSYSKANATIDAVQEAINRVSSQRSALGALQNRLEHTIANLDNVSENTQSAESRIRDTDMASEMVEYSKNNILAQAGQSMLAQANQSTQGILSLLG